MNFKKTFISAALAASFAAPAFAYELPERPAVETNSFELADAPLYDGPVLYNIPMAPTTDPYPLREWYDTDEEYLAAILVHDEKMAALQEWFVEWSDEMNHNSMFFQDAIDATISFSSQLSEYEIERNSAIENAINGLPMNRSMGGGYAPASMLWLSVLMPSLPV